MLRLTGGEFRGRMIETPLGERTRPTQARLRQALFNSIQEYVGEARVLDLFSGAGTLGFEALSRGASHVTFVEQNRNALKLLEKNVRTLDVLERISIIAESVDHAFGRILKGGPYDIVLADPPYAAGWEKRILEGFEGRLSWAEGLSPEGLLLLEWGRLKSRDFKAEELPDTAPFLVKVRERIYGESVLTTYKKAKLR